MKTQHTAEQKRRTDVKPLHDGDSDRIPERPNVIAMLVCIRTQGE